MRRDKVRFIILAFMVRFRLVAEDKGVELDADDKADKADKVRILLARVGLIGLPLLRSARFHPQGGLEFESRSSATIFYYPNFYLSKYRRKRRDKCRHGIGGKIHSNQCLNLARELGAST